MEFNSSTPTSQTFFFTNQAVTVTGSEIKPCKERIIKFLVHLSVFSYFCGKKYNFRDITKSSPFFSKKRHQPLIDVSVISLKELLNDHVRIAMQIIDSPK